MNPAAAAADQCDLLLLCIGKRVKVIVNHEQEEK